MGIGIDEYIRIDAQVSYHSEGINRQVSGHLFCHHCSGQEEAIVVIETGKIPVPHSSIAEQIASVCAQTNSEIKQS